MSDPLAALRRKLERWELEHLRQHAADLATRLELAEEEARIERANADYWQDQAMTMIQELQADGATVGLTQEGQIIVGLTESGDPIVKRGEPQ